MAKDYGITDIDKGIDDILNTYERENLKEKRDEILKSLEDSELDNESKLALERELNDIIIKLAKYLGGYNEKDRRTRRNNRKK